MKKLLIIAIAGLLFTSCEKGEPDYREKFVGRYECTVDSYSFHAPSGDYSTETYLDTIEVGMAEDSMLTLLSVKDEYYFDYKGGEFIVGNEGNFSLHYSDWEVRLYGCFFNDSIMINSKYNHKGLFGSEDLFKGKKIK